MPDINEGKGILTMFDLKNKLLKKVQQNSPTTEQEELEKVQVATCVILIEVAKSDYDFSSIEKTTVEAIMKRDFQISAEAAEDLIEIAKRSRGESIDLFEFTNLINKNYSKEEKKKVIEGAWKIIYADKKLDKYEDHLIHRLAKLLRLDHEDLIEAKLKALHEYES